MTSTGPVLLPRGAILIAGVLLPVSAWAQETWTQTSGSNAPTPRWMHTAVWTGREMIIWGGQGGTYLNTGARYEPKTDSWNVTTTVAAPSPRLRTRVRQSARLGSSQSTSESRRAYCSK